jgi:hypothetical protein
MLPGLLTVTLYGFGAAFQELQPYWGAIARYAGFVLFLLMMVSFDLALAALFIMATA